MKPYFWPLHKGQSGVLSERIGSSETRGVNDVRSAIVSGLTGYVTPGL